MAGLNEGMGRLTIERIVCSVGCGSPIDEIKTIARRIAKRHGARVYFEFNGHPLCVTPDGKCKDNFSAPNYGDMESSHAT